MNVPAGAYPPFTIRLTSLSSSISSLLLRHRLLPSSIFLLPVLLAWVCTVRETESITNTRQTFTKEFSPSKARGVGETELIRNSENPIGKIDEDFTMERDDSLACCCNPISACHICIHDTCGCGWTRELLLLSKQREDSYRGRIFRRFYYSKKM